MGVKILRGTIIRLRMLNESSRENMFLQTIQKEIL